MKKGKSVQQRIDEMRRPPTLANWVRLNARRRDETTTRIARFVLAKPRHALTLVYGLLADYVNLGSTAENVRTGIDGLVDPLVQRLGHEIATALLPWFDKNQIRGLPAFSTTLERFPIGRKVFIPIRPTFVAMINGRPTPVFIIGWTAQNALTGYQKQLLATMIYSALLTQEDFIESDALVLFTPRHKYSTTAREIREMWVSKIPLLTDEQLRAQFKCYGDALDDALVIVSKILDGEGK